MDHVVGMVVQRGCGDGAREMDRLLHTDTDTAILMKAIEHVPLPARRNVVKGGGISFI